MKDQTIVLLSSRELEKMRAVGCLVVELLSHLEPLVQPGISTRQLNDAAQVWTQKSGAVSAALGYHGFPASICTSVNEVVCNGIPSAKEILMNGDIINVTVMLQYNGFYGKTSRTFFVGEPSINVRKLVEVALECLNIGIKEVKPGATLGDIGAAIQEHAESQGYSVVRDFCGHGIGRSLHMAPQIFHYGSKGKGIKLRPGMVFCIEPMINEGSWHVRTLSDKFTAVTVDHKLSAQFEHMVAVTSDGVEILTAFKYPRFTDVVLGGQNPIKQPRPYNVVLGEQSRPKNLE